MSPNPLSPDLAGLARLLAGRKLFLLDMDGTLYLGDTLFPFAASFLKAIREFGASYLFLTNNSSKGTDAYVEKLGRLGIPAAPGDFFTSTDAACSYLRAHDRDRLIYALGTESFKAQLRREGFPVVETVEEGVNCLLMGYDTELTYRKLVDASVLLTRGVEYLATNPDWVCPTAFGYVPDCGSIAQALEHATGRLPRFLGKPEPEIALLAMEKAGAKPEETVLVGDRIYTDILCGKRAGAATILVFSGETTPDVCRQSETQPDFAVENAGYIQKAMEYAQRGC
jgi:HAD superfamily hydrolase (TIGR01450 family)